MGWRERDWARLEPGERKALFDGSRAQYSSGRHFGTSSGVLVAVVVSATIFVLGQVPRDKPILPPLHVTIPSIPFLQNAPRPRGSVEGRAIDRLEPRVASVGSSFVVDGTSRAAGPALGAVLGHWNSRPWERIGSFRIARGGSYRVRIRLSRPGMLNLRLQFPNGDRVVGAVRVTR